MGNLSDQEYQKVVNDFNAIENISFLERRLDQLFESVVEQFPENIALIHNEIEISYQELNASANILARGLAKRGLKHGDVVGLSVSRSFDLVAVMLAVLKLGAAYVPIDPSFPAQRINHMLEDADPRFILLSDEPTEGYASWKKLCLSVSEVRDSSITDASNLGTQIHHRDLAYVLYTSGSTGRPKGVEVSHGASANFLTSLRKHEPGCNEHDRLLAITTISFDMSVLELFLPILSGATMIIANPSAVRDPREMVSLMKAHRVTILQATPATWTMLLESGWEGNPRLSKIICGGEPLLRQLADRLLASADSVWNVYGPAETTYGSVGRVGEGDIVVGRPVINGRIYLLDDNLSPVPLGCEGEVYIGGDSVSNGYRNKPELTHSRFLSNPFHRGIFFRTGDLARFLDCEKLQVIGRIDGVVKIRGHRIDVGDVEAALLDHSYVSAAVVVSRDDRLVAYCVARIPPSLIGASLDSILRPWVADRLPAYMIPSFFVPMDALPLSPNEKVNRNALPDPLEVLKRNPLSIQPTSELEQQIQAIWSDVLNHEGFGIDENFFNIGGDSVRIVRMQAALEKQLGRPVPTAKLFEHFTIKTLAAYLAGSKQIDPSKQKSRMVRPPDNTNEDIAIISMACRLPGGVATPEDFWQVLQSGGDTSTDVPKDRWDADKLYSSDPDVDGTSYCRRGGFLDSISSCDAPFFGISPREARVMDPEQHLMLELGWEGFERAGYTRDRLSGSATGVFLGISNNGASSSGPIDLKGHSITGSAGATLSGRLSYALNLQGPSLTVDTACSSSLVATHLACNALRQRECDTALVGGVSLLLTPGIHIEFSKLRGLSADGRCKAFSDDTDGTGFSEGAATVILKRLSDAKRDGDTIHAVLRGTAVMHGGNSVSLTAPNGPGQENLIRIALAQSALEPESIDYIEAHGTATKLGDPIEATALAGVFGEGRPRSDPLRLGSVKSNVGHTQAAAGLVGLLKVVLSMQNNMLPKTLHVNEPTRAIEWKSSNLELVLKNRPWLPNNNRIRRAGVSAFGIGGTNAHAIVEEFRGPTMEKTADTTQPALPASALFVLSGNSDSALRAQAGKIQSHMEIGSGIDHRLHDVAYSLATSRTHFHHRVAFSARDKQHMLKQLESISSSASELPSSNEAGKASLGMLFTGQGSQRIGMGKELYTVFPIFKDALDEIATQFTDLEYPLLDVMWAEPGSSFASLLNRTDFAQPALFALQVSLWTLWQSWGVKATLLLGHSVGELAVAHISGILNLEDACRLVLMRGRLMQAISRHGKMIAIESNSTDVAAVIKQLDLSNEVQIASHNTPSQTVVSGDVTAIGAVEAHFASLGVKRRVLDTSHAFHSHHMDEILDDFKAIAKTVQFFPQTTPIISSMTGKLASEGELQQAEYWTKQIRNAVQFCDAFQSLSDAGANIFLEIGPSPTLCGLGAACLSGTPQARNAVWLPSLKPNADGCSVIQDSIGKLHVRDVPVDWPAFYEPLGCQRVELPTYAFQREVTQSAKQRWFDTSAPNTDPEKIAQDMRNMMFEINWRPIESRVAPSHGSWGLLYPSEETTWTKDVQNALSSAGINLVPVTKHQEAEGLDGLLSLWDSKADVVQTAHNFTEKALSQLQEAIQTGYAAPVVWVTRHAISAGHGDRPLRIGGAPLLGLMRTARSEYPELCLRLIDMDDETPLATLSSALMLGDPTEIVIRNKQLLEPHMERMSSAVASSSPPKQLLLRAGGTVLLTGGLGDLGSRVARRLVTSHGVRDLVLLSRRGMQTPGAEAIVTSLAKLGAKATVVAVDLAVLEDLRSVMQLFSSERPLRGVVHAAGVVDSGTLPSLTPQKCASTFTPKINGLWNLHQLTKRMDLDFFVMFSSISGVMGLPGLGNYAAANSFVDMLAFMRRGQGLPATSLAYGTWDGDGMVTTLISSTRAHLSQLGLGLISPEIGLDLFEQAIREGRTLSVPALLDIEQLKIYYENQGGVPPFLRSMLGQIEVTKPVLLTANLRQMLIEATPESRRGIVLHMVQATVAKALEYTRPEDLDANRPLEDFGIDSLTAVLMRNRLTTLTGVGLPPNITLLYPNLNSLSDYLLAKLAKEIDEPITTVPVISHVDMAAIRRGVLDPKFQFRNAIKHTTGWSEPPKNVLVTGPTGFVGAFMVYEFLRRGMDVYCLVRASNDSQAQERMVKTLQRYNLWKSDYEPLLHVVVGDLSRPLFGLCEAEFDDLANAVDSILHSGALVDWMRPLEEYVGPNILGTHEILRLASRGRGKAVHFISTISTLPIHLGYGLTENDREYGYGTSKYMAERMVAAARFRGAMTSSYRLPFVAASATNGQFRLDRGDFLNNLITGSLDLGVFPSIAADMSSVLPVDYLCNTIATIMIGDHQRIGEDYDFINPQSPTFDEFFQLMGAASGGKAIIPFSKWHVQALEYAAVQPKSCVARITAILDGYTDETAGEMVKGGPLSKHVLGLDIYPAPLIDEKYVHRYLKCLMAAKAEI